MSNPIRVCSFESRRCHEMVNLIERFGGVAIVAPSMQEIPLTENDDVFEFGDLLASNSVDIVILMTGVGTEALFEVLSTKLAIDEIRSHLQNCLLVARGPKPVAALSKFQMKADLKAPEPNTWHELARCLQEAQAELVGKTVAVQEYGQPSLELYEWLNRQGAKVLPVPVYRWALPDNIEPLKAAIHAIIAGEIDLILWTSAQQVNHVLQVAKQMNVLDQWMAAANACVIASIGPTNSERLIELGLPADFEPSHPKMAHLARESIEAYARLSKKG